MNFSPPVISKNLAERHVLLHIFHNYIAALTPPHSRTQIHGFVDTQTGMLFQPRVRVFVLEPFSRVICDCFSAPAAAVRRLQVKRLQTFVAGRTSPRLGVHV